MRRIAVLLAAIAALIAQTAVARERLAPAELPPASYKGQQYVDSRGCLFLRAGDDERVNWVPRVTREGQPLCGYPPSGRQVRSDDTAIAAPAAAATAPSASAAEVKLACPADLPIAQKVAVKSGTRVICTKGDGTFGSAVLPMRIAADGTIIDPAYDTAPPIAGLSEADPAPKAAVDPKPAASGGTIFVAVGSFGQVANSEAAARRLGELGFPVRRTRLSSAGRSLEAIYAGPFSSEAVARDALATLRAAGFAEAVIVK